ncbi:MAG: carboxymethylenebutenolidase [Nocardioidaceae bacterium]|jgi:carboxymethylenebutenolidase|nr:carboxymethylenebutenolidase [Nocardioidaceae bacterium]
MTSVTTVEVPTHDGSADALLAVPDGDGPWPGVLLFMDAFGLRPRLRDMASTLAEHGYVTLVPNVFYRAGRAPVVDVGGLDTADGRTAAFDKLRPLIQGLTPELATEDAAAYLQFLEADPRVADPPFATVGYCMGAALAFRAAAVAGDRMAAVAGFHGGRLATDDPASPHLLVDRLSAEVYLAHADEDGSMPPEQQRRLADALDGAGVRYTAELYDGARHGFTMADTAMYDEAATEQHWDRLLALLDRRLKDGSAKSPQIG